MQIGKDRIVFTTKEDLEKPCTANIVIKEPEDPPRAMNPDGSINWDCPCIARDLTGPCGFEMREALSCLQDNAASPECRDKHVILMECLQEHSELYPWANEEKDEDDEHVAEHLLTESEDMDEKSS